MWTARARRGFPPALASPPGWVARVLAWLPRGRALPREVWVARHRCVVLILAVQSLAVPVYGVCRGRTVPEAFLAMLLPAAMALLACWRRLPDRARSALAAAGLMVLSGIFVQLSNGAIEAHFHYFVMIPVAALYQDWVPFGVAIGYVLFQHGIVGTIDPGAVYGRGSAHMTPWKMAAVHAGFMAAACLGAVANWTFHERSREAESRLADALTHQVRHDALTGLPNRTLFMDRLEASLEDATATGVMPTMLLLDLDGFKDVNDTYGHHVGDLLLIEVAERLRRCMRVEDTVTRLSGDEFAVLLATVGGVGGEQAADRVLAELTAPFALEAMDIDIEVSIGISTAEPGDDAAVLIRRADSAMYVAKEQRLGRARYEPGHQNNTTTRLDLLGALRRALQTDEIVLHYQPQVSLSTGLTVGVEALARWQHPTRGHLAPAEFISIVERTNMSRAFTACVLTTALAQSRAWLEGGLRLPVSVNVSTRCLLDAGLPDLVAGQLRAAGVPAELLCLEITENTVMEDPERAIETLRQIRSLGVKIALDDYGTGYSSMAYLRVLPLDELKVDRSFTGDLRSGEQNSSVLVRSVIELGHDLGLRVVAEGVEDEATLTELRRLGCDVAQGFHLSRPLTPASLDAWLSRRGRRGAPAVTTVAD